MTAERIGPDGVRVRVADVLGEDAPNVHGFIRHVALAAEDREQVTSKTPVAIDHMGPPVGRIDQASLSARAGVALSPAEKDAIEDFRTTVREEMEAAAIAEEEIAKRENRRPRKPRAYQYCSLPHTQTVRRPNGVMLHRRFSCAGYVLSAYDEAGIPLLAPETHSQFPETSGASLANAYSRNPAELPTAMRVAFGLQDLNGDGPWPLVLPGYVFHALNRVDKAVRAEPYLPRAGDEYFNAAPIRSALGELPRDRAFPCRTPRV